MISLGELAYIHVCNCMSPTITSVDRIQLVTKVYKLCSNPCRCRHILQNSITIFDRSPLVAQNQIACVDFYQCTTLSIILDAHYFPCYVSCM